MIINTIKYSERAVEVKLPIIITTYSTTNDKNNVVHLQQIIANVNQATKDNEIIDISKIPTYQLPVRP